MLISITTVILALAALLGLLFYPKTEGRLNGFKILVMGTIALLCYLSFCALICKLLKIFVGLPSTCASLLLLDVLLWGGVLRKKKVQRLFWRRSELIGLLLTGMFVLALAIHVFSPRLELQYRNTDASAHYEYAMSLMKTGIWSGQIYFSAYVDAVFMELFAPLVTPVTYFKAFILADIFMHVLEIWAAYYLFLTICGRREMCVLAPVFAAGYFFGYPAYSFMVGNFVYWSNGVVIFIFIIYALLLLEKHRELYRYSIPMLLLGLYGNSCCNKLFVFTNTAAVFLTFLGLVWKRYRSREQRRRLFAILVIFGGLSLLIGGIYGYLWRDILWNLTEILLEEGGIYQSIYGDLIFFLPAVFYVCYCACRKELRRVTTGVVSLGMGVIAVVMFILWYCGGMSAYYYYKIYYNLWLCGWMLTAEAFWLLCEKGKHRLFFAYFGMVVLSTGIAVSDYDSTMWMNRPEYNGEYATKNLFALYHFNANICREDFTQYRASDQMMEAVRYIVQDMTPENVQILTEDYGKGRWYQVIEWDHRIDNRYLAMELPELLAYFDAQGVDAVLYSQKDAKYARYEDYFNRCAVVYENEEAVIVRPWGEEWLQIPEEREADVAGIRELCSYVIDRLPGETVPLWAEETRYYEYMQYYFMTGTDMTLYYPWKADGEERCAGLMLEDGIRYVIVLKGDAYDEKVEQYFDIEQVVYESEAGRVLAIRQREEE